MTTPPDRMNPSVSMIGRTKRSHGRPRGHQIAAWPAVSGSTGPDGRTPDGLAPTETTGGTYSIGRPAMPGARLLISRVNGTTCSYGTPSGVKKAPYASPVTRAVTIASYSPAS
jgi:hypothetical protein